MFFNVVHSCFALTEKTHHVLCRPKQQIFTRRRLGHHRCLFPRLSSSRIMGKLNYLVLFFVFFVTTTADSTWMWMPGDSEMNLWSSPNLSILEFVLRKEWNEIRSQIIFLIFDLLILAMEQALERIKLLNWKQILMCNNSNCGFGNA